MRITGDGLTRGVRPYVWLSLLCVLLYLPGLATSPPFDRDESRFMQATRQMLETGDFIRIQFQEQMRAKKPVGAYWVQAASVAGLADQDTREPWPFRLPSAVAAWLAVLLTFGLARPLLGSQASLAGAALLGASVMLVSEAHQAKTDALLLLCTVVAQGTLARFYVAGRSRILAEKTPSATAIPPMPSLGWALLFWVAQGAGILVKGPIVPVITLLTLAALWIADRSLKWFLSLRPFTGLLVTIAMVVPWFAAISQATDGTFVSAAVNQDLLPKLIGGHESHGGFPGQYLLLAAATFWPGSLLLWPALFRFRANRQRLAPRFLLAWLVPAWLMFEFIPTKLPHYVLPLFPALALLVGALAVEGLRDVLTRVWARIWAVLWVLLGVALAAAVIVGPQTFGSVDPLWLTLPAAIALVFAVLLPMVPYWSGDSRLTVPVLLVAALVAVPTIFYGVIPAMDRLLWLSPRVAEIVDQYPTNEPTILAGYDEPSLIFLLGTNTKIGNGGAAAAHLAAHPQAMAVVESHQDREFRITAETLGLEPVLRGEVEGLNYSRGRNALLRIYGAPIPHYRLPQEGGE